MPGHKLNSVIQRLESTSEERAALEALLKIDPLQPFIEPYKTALSAHKELWAKKGYEVPAVPEITLDELKSVRARAAQQLMLFAVDELHDVNVLNTILQQATPALSRQIITEKLANGLLKSFPGADRTDEPLLTDSAVQQIQTEAALNLLPTLIAQIIDPGQLKVLLSGDENEKIQVLNQYTNPLIASRLLLCIQERADVLLQRFVQITDVNEDNLDALKTILEQKNDKLFLTEFNAHFQLNFSIDDQLDIKAAKRILGEKYLSTYLASAKFMASNADRLKNLTTCLNATNSEQLKQKLPDELNDIKDNITDANLSSLKAALTKNLLQSVAPDRLLPLSGVGEGSLAEFKQLMTKHFELTSVDWITNEHQSSFAAIVQQRLKVYRDRQIDEVNNALRDKKLHIDLLMKLVEAIPPGSEVESLEHFKKVLSPHLEPPVDVTWLDLKSMATIQTTARELAFQAKVAQLSNFEIAQHSKLTEAFAKLGREQQLALLKSEQTIGHLMQATSKEAVQHYLGIQAPELPQQLADENARLAPFKTITNSALARHLAAFEPPISLKTETIEAINNLINAKTTGLPDVDYPAFIKSVADTLPLADAETKKKFMLHFDLNEAGNTLVAEEDRKIFAAIRDQQVFNQFLLANGAQSKPVVALLLSLSKTADYDKAKLDAVIKKFKSATSRAEFVQIFPEGERAQVLQALSADRFAEIKNQLLAQDLKSSRTKQNAITDLTTRFTAVKKEHANSIKASGTLNDKLSADFLGANFALQVRKDLPKHIRESQELLTQYNLAIDKLERDKQLMEGWLSAIPRTTDKELDKVRASIKQELAQVETALGSYRQARDNVEAIKKEVDLIALQEWYVYRPSDKERGSLVAPEPIALADLADKEKLQAHIGAVGAAVAPAVSAVAAIGTHRDLLAERTKVGQGKALLYTVVGNSQTVTSKGFYAQSYNSSSEVGGRPGASIQIVQPPKVDAPPTNRQRPADLPADQKVDFYLQAALSLITANGGELPTKEHPVRLRGQNAEQLGYFWTAFVALGVDQSAIKVDSHVFDPSQQKGWAYGFKADSLHETTFKSCSSLVSLRKKELEEMTQQAKKDAKAATALTSNYRQASEQLRQQDVDGAKNQQQQDGLAFTRPR